MYQWILEHETIIGITIDLLSLIVSVFLAVIIYRLERNHEREREEMEKKIKKNELINNAKVFLLDNEDEKDYLFISMVASKLNPDKKHNRKIINNFLHCNNELQKEILDTAGIKAMNITKKAISQALDELDNDLENYKFGDSVLYDGGKYFHRALEYWSNNKIEDVNPFMFESIYKNDIEDKESFCSVFANEKHHSLGEYMWNYLRLDYSSKKGIDNPVDMVYRECNLANCEEKDMTFWTMRIVIDSCNTFKKTKTFERFNENLIETQEDMYYYAVATLCDAYPHNEGANNGKIS